MTLSYIFLLTGRDILAQELGYDAPEAMDLLSIAGHIAQAYGDVKAGLRYAEAIFEFKASRYNARMAYTSLPFIY